MENKFVPGDEEYFDAFKYSSPFYSIQSSHTKQERLHTRSQLRETSTDLSRSLKKAKSHGSRELSQMLYLRSLIKKFRIQRIVGNFCSKIKRNITNSKPVEVSMTQNSSEQYGFVRWLSVTEGLTIPNSVSLFITTISTFLAIVMSVLYSLQLVFLEIEETSLQNVIQPLALSIFVMEVFLKLVLKHYKKGKLLFHIKEIALSYLKDSFYLDFTVVIVILLCQVSDSKTLEIRVLRMIIIVKLWENIQKNDFSEMPFLTSFQRQQYFELLTVLITNLCFAHLMSLCLNCMAMVNTEDNWLVKRNLNLAPWHIRYTWGVYWGTTIMLTVGFGDFAATNYTQALCLTFIQMISCISLSYNINCVGNIINNIKSQKQEKKKNQRVLTKMVRENRIEEQLENRLNNYVEEAFQIRREFNIQEEEKLLQSVPGAMKRDYLKSITARVFLEVPFLLGLTEKGRSYLAEAVNRFVTHPEEIILKRGAEPELLILNKGELGFCIKKQNCNQNGMVIEKITVGPGSMSKLVSLDFLKPRLLNYSIKSISYSILYSINKENIVKHLKQTKTDYQLFCALRDRSIYFLRDYELYKCPCCLTEYHNKFECPKLHYIPFPVQVIAKYRQSLKVCKQNNRISLNRNRLRFVHVLAIFGTVLKELESVIEINSINKKIQPKPQRKRRSAMFSDRKKILQTTSFSDLPISKTQKTLDCVEDQTQDKFAKVLEQIMLTRRSICEEQPYDLMYDWSNYFPQYNPSRLRDAKL